jgi:hypothetical protein
MVSIPKTDLHLPTLWGVSIMAAIFRLELKILHQDIQTPIPPPKYHSRRSFKFGSSDTNKESLHDQNHD